MWSERDIDKYVEFFKEDKIKICVRKIVDKIRYVDRNYDIAVTNFLNPYELNISLTILENYCDNKYIQFPKNEDSERKILIIFPNHIDEVLMDNYIGSIRIENKSKLISLKHKDYLGAILSLGIDRRKIGDIVVSDEYADVVMKKDICNYLKYNIEKIGKSKVEIIDIDLDEIKYENNNYSSIIINVSSLRLDNIIKAITKNGRDICNKKINSGDIKINWKQILKNTYNLEEGDLISIRGYGRYKIDKIIGVTKKDRYKLNILYYTN